ncbi:pyrimidine-specific ribonucleoside hydrolase RihA-like isoform X2 [Bradysia coprophila]|uniref:pyrimidine-specific ribonucleoside hydrolase RihA-like isoform X2 n=1 Tax=Bradysia coprophila TaxID=38358 RepID=UPI00187DAD7A|nr:pyrimidine-specific ribonucleoside hydrolase RihA-like isoform X2 [Bradysia coprophila]
MSLNDTRMINDNTELIIFDSDAGIDDAWALLMLLKAEQVRNIKVIAITLVHGNTTVDYAADNCLRILNSVNRTDVPIYKGARESLLPKCPHISTWFGVDGFGDMDYDDEPERFRIQSEHAVSAMYRLVNEHPGKITFVCVGPLTNVALAIKMYHDFADKVKSLYIMGGNCSATGNSSSCAEFNFYCDPESAFILLKSLQCPIYMLPWETCMEDKIDIPLEWRIEELGKTQNKMMELLNEAEIKVFRRNKCVKWNPCDAFVTAVLLKPNEIILKSKNCHATVELSGSLTRGQVVIDHLNRNQNNITIVEQVDVEKCKQLFLWTAGCDNIEF